LGQGAVDRPDAARLAVQLDAKLGVAGELAFEILIPLKIFDRNSNVRFHKFMAATGLQNSPVHGLMHGPAYIKS